MHELMHPRIRPRAAEQAACDRRTVERLRQATGPHASAEASKPTADVVQIVVNDLLSITPLAETLAKMPRHNVDEAEAMVLDIVATFGTWLTHSEGTSGVDVSYAVDDLQMSLFQVATRRTSTANDEDRTVDPITVKMPVGYEPSATKGRDVSKALAAIVASRPDADVIARFVSRTYRTRSAALTYPLIAGVWKFAAAGRLDRIDKVSSDPVFHSQVVAAFDLLDVARCEAIEAVDEIISMRSELTPERLKMITDRAGWLSEVDFNRIARIAEMASTGDGLGVYRRAASHLATALESQPKRFRPISIASLTAGQVRRICSMAGLKVEEDSRTAELEIRAMLRDLGFNRDADRLVPEALRAQERGQADEFWAIMVARSEGDRTWSEQLEELASS